MAAGPIMPKTVGSSPSAHSLSSSSMVRNKLMRGSMAPSARSWPSARQARAPRGRICPSRGGGPGAQGQGCAVGHSRPLHTLRAWRALAGQSATDIDRKVKQWSAQGRGLAVAVTRIPTSWQRNPKPRSTSPAIFIARSLYSVSGPTSLILLVPRSHIRTRMPSRTLHCCRCISHAKPSFPSPDDRYFRKEAALVISSYTSSQVPTAPRITPTALKKMPTIDMLSILLNTLTKTSNPMNTTNTTWALWSCCTDVLVLSTWLILPHLRCTGTRQRHPQ